jgi:steroid delta-isomerase-like uncharacterized protein
MSAPSTMISQQQLIDAAKAPILAFNDKDWDALRANVSSEFVYDEVPTGRKPQGADQVIPLWQGWAEAFPDAKATFDNTLVVDNTVILEVTWRGTHKGQLQTPGGPIDATENPIDVRSCFVVEMSGDRIRQERHYFDMGTILQQLGITA